jgi:hypothetical protein
MCKSFITISVLIVAIDLQWVYHLTCDKPKAAPYRYLFNNTSRQHENLLPFMSEAIPPHAPTSVPP